MPSTRIWIHLVWSTKNREPLLQKEIRAKMFEHIGQNAKSKEILLDSLNGYVDHVHALIRLKPDQSLSKVVQLLKGESSHWANAEQLTETHFEWQDEYFAESVSESGLQAVRDYIKNQEVHHRRKTFGEEYAEFMKQYDSEAEGLKP
jgi:REP element-mobilizing transposase RayT